MFSMFAVDKLIVCWEALWAALTGVSVRPVNIFENFYNFVMLGTVIVHVYNLI